MIITFQGYKDKLEEAEKYKREILKLIDQFVEIEDVELLYKSKPGDIFNCYDFYIDSQRRGDFVIQYYFGQTPASRELHLTHDQYLKLQEFMKDPDLYKNSKKYNL